jgi:hypothetical protein
MIREWEGGGNSQIFGEVGYRGNRLVIREVIFNRRIIINCISSITQFRKVGRMGGPHPIL